MLNIRKMHRSVIDALRAERPGQWRYDKRGHQWVSEDRNEKVHRVHTGGYDESGEASKGAGYFVYDRTTGEHLGRVHP